MYGSQRGELPSLVVAMFYGYNVRDELIAADEVSYAYDDIGNRTTAEGKTYTANNLNQYTAIDDFVPEYDADGNQTLIQTSTGVWQVTYNAENRPILWEQDDTVVTMAFDRMGRSPSPPAPLSLANFSTLSSISTTVTKTSPTLSPPPAPPSTTPTPPLVL